MLRADLKTLSDGCGILPNRSGAIGIDLKLSPSSVSVGDPLESVVRSLSTEAGSEALAAVTPIGRTYGGGYALVAGVIALENDAVELAVEMFERVLRGPAVSPAPMDGTVSLSFTTTGTVYFYMNSLAAVGLLFVALTRAGRKDDARNLVGEAFDITENVGFLTLELISLGTDGEHERAIDAADALGDFDSPLNMEIATLRAQALEGVGRTEDSILAYQSIAKHDADFTWVVQARASLERLGSQLSARGASTATQDAPDDDVLRRIEERDERNESLEGWTYAPLAISRSSVESTPSWALPPTTSAPRLDPAGNASLVLGARGDAIRIYDPEAAFQIIGAPLLRRAAMRVESSASPMVRCLGALSAAAADGFAGLHRLVGTINADLGRSAADTSRFGYLVSVTIAEVTFYSSNGMDCLPLAAAAVLLDHGDPSTAMRWVRWAGAGSSNWRFELAEVVLAFQTGDDDVVLALTQGAQRSDAKGLILQSYRARSFLRLGRTETAIKVLNAIVSRASRIFEDAADSSMLSIRYLRARALMSAGLHARAKNDLYAIEAAASQTTSMWSANSPSSKDPLGDVPASRSSSDGLCSSAMRVGVRNVTRPSTCSTTTSSPSHSAVPRGLRISNCSAERATGARERPSDDRASCLDRARSTSRD